MEATLPEEHDSDDGLTEELANSTEFADEEYGRPDEDEIGGFTQAVLWGTDWTAETIISQMERGNIEMNPRFQRRDAWSRSNKTKFIESLILGLPIPQIVLAEKKEARGRYIVLDGKQRLLSLANYAALGEGKDVGFRLSSLDIRNDLKRKRYKDLKDDPSLRDDFEALNSHTLRTVVIRNWPSLAFLHLVFLRLNTGSLKLSPQELRQAAVPGPFSDFADDFALESEPIQALLGRKSPDPRMRDVELIVRHLALHFYITNYRGRMKEFLDTSCENFNENWPTLEDQVREAATHFVEAIVILQTIFGAQGVARKKGSRLFNRSIFDALVFYAVDPEVREKMLESQADVRAGYNEVIENKDFQTAVESDTAGIPNTTARLAIWGAKLSEILKIELGLPSVNDQNEIVIG
jgi:hypothetical protein